MSNTEVQEAIAISIIVDEYTELTYGESKRLEPIIEQFIRNGEDKGIEEEDMVNILLSRLRDDYNDIQTIQTGGDYIYTIQFTNLKYNSIYLFSKLNFIGYVLADSIFKEYNRQFQYNLNYKLDGSDSCKLTLVETTNKIKFKKYNITSAHRFYVDTRVDPSKAQEYIYKADYSYPKRALKEKNDNMNINTNIKMDEPYWTNLLNKVDDNYKQKQKKELNKLLRDIDSYDGKMSAITDTDEEHEEFNEENNENVSQLSLSAEKCIQKYQIIRIY